MKSLDPRVNRLQLQNEQLFAKAPLDQFGNFEVFVQVKEDKPYQHAGAVHAPNPEMAFLFAKEQFSRRQTCTGLFVVDTRHVFVTNTTENETNIYEEIVDNPALHGTAISSFEVFHLYKRGKQHDHIGSIEAKSPLHALTMAKEEFIDGPPVLNIWVVKSADIRFSEEADRVMWDTLPEKSFREATDYKASDKLKEFKEEKR